MNVGIYARVSTKNQTTENQLRELKDVCDRMGWSIVRIFEDNGVSGAKGRYDRPAFNDLYNAITRKEIDIVVTWAVDRIARSLPDLIAFMTYAQDRSVGLYFHQQGLDTSRNDQTTKIMIQLLGIFGDFERSIIQARVKSGIERKRKETNGQWGRPGIGDWKTNRIRKQLNLGKGVREIARMVNVSPATVSKIKKEMVTTEAA